MNNISPYELKERIKRNEVLFLLDVREKIEYYSFNIGGVLIPLSQLPDALESLPEDKSGEIIVICQKGIRSRTAQVLLENAGYQYVRNLTGGLSAFNRI